MARTPVVASPRGTVPAVWPYGFACIIVLPLLACESPEEHADVALHATAQGIVETIAPPLPPTDDRPLAVDAVAPPAVPVPIDRLTSATELVTRERPTPPSTDLPRVVDATITIAEGSRVELGPVLDARLAPHGRTAWTIERDGRLVAHDLSTRTPRDLFTDADPPLAVERTGERLAFARGAMPDFEIVVLEATSGRVVWQSESMAPAWTPAFSDDGRTLYFVSGALGSPWLYEVALDPPGQPTPLVSLEDAGGLPMGPGAPACEGRRLVWSDTTHTWALDLDTLRATPVGEGLLWFEDGAPVLPLDAPVGAP